MRLKSFSWFFLFVVGVFINSAANAIVCQNVKQDEQKLASNMSNQLIGIVQNLGWEPKNSKIVECGMWRGFIIRTTANNTAILYPARGVVSWTPLGSQTSLCFDYQLKKQFKSADSECEKIIY
jgi:hypothetical protein